MPGHDELIAFREKLEGLGESEVEKSLSLNLWGDTESPRNWRRREALAFLNRKEEERDEAHRDEILKTANDANDIARQANDIARGAKAWAKASAWGAFGAFVIAALAFAKSMGWF